MPFCRLYIIVTYRNGRGFAETGKKVKKKNLHEREENGGQHVARSGRQALGREKTGKTDCCGQRHHGASLTRSPGRQYLRLNHCFVYALAQSARHGLQRKQETTDFTDHTDGEKEPQVFFHRCYPCNPWSVFSKPCRAPVAHFHFNRLRVDHLLLHQQIAERLDQRAAFAQDRRRSAAAFLQDFADALVEQMPLLIGEIGRATCRERV